jgi:signal transduction histidine kinase
MPTSVLIVDDEPNVLNIIREAVATAGFQVTTCESGNEALPLLDAQPPDLLLTDLRMPGISGLELLRSTREISPDTQVVILTGYGDMKSAVEALHLGAFDYLSKPVDKERLVQTLQNGSERRRLILENRDLVRSLEESNRLKTEFINGMSHEVRTPLGQIQGFAQILQDTLDGLTDKQVGYLQNILTASNRLLNMFEDILQYSTLKQGETRIVPEPLIPSEFMAECLLEHKELADTKNLCIETEATDRIVSMDHKICRKAVSLLLDNAVKFISESGNIVLEAKGLPSPPSGISGPGTPQAREWFHISIADDGPGIPTEDQERIFNLFEQADGGLDRKFEGTGLGLALAQSLARAHGGQVSLKSTPGIGSTFTLALPLPK